jgi:hypothetical protein
VIGLTLPDIGICAAATAAGCCGAGGSGRYLAGNQACRPFLWDGRQLLDLGYPKVNAYASVPASRNVIVTVRSRIVSCWRRQLNALRRDSASQRMHGGRGDGLK